MQQFKPTKRFWKNYNSLYGTSAPIQTELSVVSDSASVTPQALIAPKAPKTPICIVPSEQDEQFRAHAWLAKNGIVHHHSPNGGARDWREGAKFKRMGTSAGFPDFVIPYARKGYHGLYIELKRVSGGKLSDVQVWWRDFLIKEGHAWFEAKGAGELIKIVSDYMDLGST